LKKVGNALGAKIEAADAKIVAFSGQDFLLKKREKASSLAQTWCSWLFLGRQLELHFPLILELRNIATFQKLRNGQK
jgi:hypothetical protein